MTERVKLKRGLSDISPLFSKTNLVPAVRTKIVGPDKVDLIQKPVYGPEVFFIWSVDDEGDAHFLNNFFASKLVSTTAPALLMTIGSGGHKDLMKVKKESWSRSLQRVSMSEQRLREAFRGSDVQFESVQEKAGTQIFIESNIRLILDNPDLIKLIDHFVIFMKPQVDSITEAYRKLKRITAQGMNAEVAVLFDADEACGLPASLYEMFSDFISRRLSLAVNYLGALHLSRGGEGLRQDICWDDWNALRTLRPESIEKIRFLSWIEKLNVEELNQ